MARFTPATHATLVPARRRITAAAARARWLVTERSQIAKSEVTCCFAEPVTVRAVRIEQPIPQYEFLDHVRAGFERYERMVNYIAGLLAPGRERAVHGERLPEITERAMASGVAMLVAQRLSLARESELPGIAGEAIQFVLTPYLGTAEARRIGAG